MSTLRRALRHGDRRGACCWCSARTSPSDVGLWVLAIGLARYVFLAAKVPLPWLRGQAPPRPWCKVVAALQGIVLLVAASGLLPEPVAVAALLVALALLVESFAHEAWDLWRRPAAAPPAALGHPADRPARVPGRLGRPGRPRRGRCGLARRVRPDPARRAGPGRPRRCCCPGAAGGLAGDGRRPGARRADRAQAPRPRRLGRLRAALRPARRPRLHRRRRVLPPRRDGHRQRLDRHRARGRC